MLLVPVGWSRSETVVLGTSQRITQAGTPAKPLPNTESFNGQGGDETPLMKEIPQNHHPHPEIVTLYSVVGVRSTTPVNSQTPSSARIHEDGHRRHVRRHTLKHPVAVVGGLKLSINPFISTHETSTTTP